LAWKQNKTGEKSMETLEFRIIGEAALLMNNCRDAMNLFSPATIRRKELEKKRNRTDSEEDELNKIKYMQALYFTKESGVFIPSTNIEACIQNGASETRKGKDIPRGLVVVDDYNSLIYDGPKDPEKLWETSEFVDIRPACVSKSNKNKIMKYRPVFHEWELKFTVNIDTEILNPKDIIKYLEIAGKKHGLGDYRPRFGRFEVA
jgi:hypothetical protein